MGFDMDLHPGQILSIDIGGTYTKIGAVNHDAEIFEFSRINTDTEQGHLQEYLSTLFRRCEQVIKISPKEINGIGISILGWLNDDRTGTIFSMNKPSLSGINIKQVFMDKFGLPIKITEDLVAHNLAEYYWGIGQGCDRFMAIVLGTGVGASMIIGGEPLGFTGGCIGDAGHILLHPDGPECSAGCRGCAEAFLSTTNIERIALKKYQYSVLPSEIIRRARENSDVKAVEVMSEIGMYTGELIASLAPIFLPRKIAILGGTSKAGEPLINSARIRFEELVGKYHRNCIRYTYGYYLGMEIALGNLDKETGLIGAAAQFFFKN